MNTCTHPDSTDTHYMPEPSTATAAGGALAWKLLGGAAGAAAAAAFVVMLMTPPRNVREWAVGIVTTVFGSVTGGAFVIQRFSLHAWTDSYAGLVALIGLAFCCGLPAWAVVRWAFIWIERRNGKDLAEVAQDLRNTFKG